MYKIEIYDSKDGPRFRIIAKNGNIIAHSEAYSSKTSRKRTIDKLINNHNFSVIEKKEEVIEIYIKNDGRGHDYYHKTKNNKEISITEKEYDKIELKNKKIEKIDYIKRNHFTRFEIMDI